MLGTKDPMIPWDGTRGQQSAQATIEYWKAINGCTGASVKKDFTDNDPNDGCRVHSERWEGKAPVLILHGDRHDLHKLNKPLFLPLMQEAGVRVQYREYPGYGHGFYFGGGDDRWGKGADEAVVAAVISDVRTFLHKAIPPGPSRPNVFGKSEPVVECIPCRCCPPMTNAMIGFCGSTRNMSRHCGALCARWCPRATTPGR